MRARPQQSFRVAQLGIVVIIQDTNLSLPQTGCPALESSAIYFPSLLVREVGGQGTPDTSGTLASVPHLYLLVKTLLAFPSRIIQMHMRHDAPFWSLVITVA